MCSHRETWAEVHLDKIERNIAAFLRLLRPSCRMMAVVKADGYGHGATEVARTAIEAGAICLGVAFLDEALHLRSEGIQAPILVMGYTKPDSVAKAAEHDIRITVYTDHVLAAVLQISEASEKPIHVHLKVDTGMSRNGLTSKEQVLKFAQDLCRARKVKLEGVFTHFSESDNPDSDFTFLQFERFQTIVKYLEDNGVAVPLVHCCNSAAAIHYPAMHLDMVRVGIGMYGFSPSGLAGKEDMGLQPAMHFKARIASVKTLPKGSFISYGRSYQTAKESLIATLPVGYADGLPRQLSNKGVMQINGYRVPIVGTICMDHTMLDVSAVPNVKMGDEAVIFDGDLTAGSVAEQVDTISYELICGIGKRVPRVYLNGGQVVKVNHVKGV